MIIISRLGDIAAGSDRTLKHRGEGVKGRVCVPLVVALRLKLSVSKMHAMHFNSCWNMEISGGDVCFRAKHLPKDSVDLKI